MKGHPNFSQSKKGLVKDIMNSSCYGIQAHRGVMHPSEAVLIFDELNIVRIY